MSRPNFAKQMEAPVPPQPESAHTPLSAQYSDASSSYWPPGWSFERFRAATMEDLEQLPPDELTKMQAGLRDVLGEDGVGRLAQQLFQEQKKRKTSESEAKEPSLSGSIVPNWLKHWEKRRQRQPWGFVALRAACYEDEARWTEFKMEVQRIIDIQFERVPITGSEIPHFKEARENFAIRWIEGDASIILNADALREKYNELRSNMPSAFSQELFLCATPESVDSVLTTDTSDRPTADSAWWRKGAPFLVAVAANGDPGLEEGHEERDWFQPVFKVAIETMVDELWWILDSDIMPLRRVTRYTRGHDELGATRTSDGDELDDIWWTTAPSPERLRKRRKTTGA
ncbi:hypothetical protein GQX73_g6781 [Xylaria multiplex]|uniref:Uncharacterized protein n=1 Tax=Xylaria multiplex TaxID=323545 RepID=A0A7C8ILP0_9PEZI|nr:hypothetical protein GQX73_g6781 [Xylaria multiplex]